MEQVIVVDTSTIVNLLLTNGVKGLDVLLGGEHKIVLTRNIVKEMNNLNDGVLVQTFDTWYKAHKAVGEIITPHAKMVL